MKFAKILAAGLMATSLAFAAEGEANEGAAKKASNIGVGVRAAFNYNSMYGLSDDWNVYADDADAPAGIGFEAGLAAKFQVLPFMQFTPEVLFNYAALSQDDGDITRDFKQMGIEIPLLLRVNPLMGLFLTVGPTLEFNVSDEEKVDFGTMTIKGVGNVTHDWDEGFERNSFQFGLTLGAGYYFMDQFYADFRLNMGFTEVYKGESILVDLSGGKQMTYKIGLGYWFM